MSITVTLNLTSTSAMFGPHYPPHTNRCSLPLTSALGYEYEATHSNRTSYTLSAPDKVDSPRRSTGHGDYCRHFVERFLTIFDLGKDRTTQLDNASPATGRLWVATGSLAPAGPFDVQNPDLVKEIQAMPGYFPFADEESFLKRRPVRPSGALGKPNDGGYSLPHTLGWDETSYRAVQASFEAYGCSEPFQRRNTVIFTRSCKHNSRYLNLLRSPRSSSDWTVQTRGTVTAGFSLVSGLIPAFRP